MALAGLLLHQTPQGFSSLGHTLVAVIGGLRFKLCGGLIHWSYPLWLGAWSSCPLSNMHHLVIIIIPAHMYYEITVCTRFILRLLIWLAFLQNPRKFCSLLIVPTNSTHWMFGNTLVHTYFCMHYYRFPSRDITHLVVSIYPCILGLWNLSCAPLPTVESYVVQPSTCARETYNIRFPFAPWYSASRWCSMQVNGAHHRSSIGMYNWSAAQRRFHKPMQSPCKFCFNKKHMFDLDKGAVHYILLRPVNTLRFVIMLLRFFGNEILTISIFHTILPVWILYAFVESLV